MGNFSSNLFPKTAEKLSIFRFSSYCLDWPGFDKFSAQQGKALSYVKTGEMNKKPDEML
jgi:hypothetical protein